MSQMTEPLRRLPMVLRVAIVTVVTLALAMLAIAAIGATPVPTTVAPAAGTTEKQHGQKEKGGGGGMKGITITAIAGSDIALKTEDGWTRTITVSSATEITKGGQTIALGDLAVGDEISFRQERNADGTFSILAIRVRVPHVGGEVTAIGATSLTLKDKAGATRTITLTASTVYTVGQKAGTKADVKVGSKVDVEGTPGTGTNFTATSVHVKLPKIRGEVTATGSGSITVKQKDGTSATIHVDSGTTYAVKGVESAKLADVKVGMRVKAEGTLRADGSLDADSVSSRLPKGHGAPSTP